MFVPPSSATPPVPVPAPQARDASGGPGDACVHPSGISNRSMETRPPNASAAAPPCSIATAIARDGELLALSASMSAMVAVITERAATPEARIQALGEWLRLHGQALCCVDTAGTSAAADARALLARLRPSGLAATAYVGALFDQLTQLEGSLPDHHLQLFQLAQMSTPSK